MWSKDSDVATYKANVAFTSPLSELAHPSNLSSGPVCMDDQQKVVEAAVFSPWICPSLPSEASLLLWGPSLQFSVFDAISPPSSSISPPAPDSTFIPLTLKGKLPVILPK